MELSNTNKALIALLLVCLTTWGSREYFYTRHLKTQAQVDEKVKTVQQEEAVKRAEVMVEKGAAYKEIRALESQLETMKKSKGSKRTLPDGTVVEDWESTETSSLVEKATKEMQDQLTELSRSLEDTSLKLASAEDRERSLQELYDEAVSEKKSLQKRATLLLGYGLTTGTAWERLKLGGLLHLGVFSVGLSASPASAIDETVKPVDQREENGWLKGLAPVAWGGFSF